MNSRFRILGVVLSLVFGFNCYAIELKTAEDSVAYALGIVQGQNVANMVKQQSETFQKSFNFEMLIEGMRSVFAETPKDFIQEEAVRIIQDYAQRQDDVERVKNKAEGEKFLKENKKKKGVKETASGLQYKVLSASKNKDAKSPDSTSLVTVEYEGRLIDGKVFDSSYKREEQATFALDKVILGFAEGIQLMKEGDEFEFYVPANLAYGDKGVPSAIPPASVLIFKIKLHKVETPPMTPREKAEQVDTYGDYNEGEEGEYEEEYNDDNIEE